jgi:hypothetical protein
VLIGAPRPLLNNNADTIVACAEDSGTLGFAEAVENLDDRLTGSYFSLSGNCPSLLTSPHFCDLPNIKRVKLDHDLSG